MFDYLMEKMGVSPRDRRRVLGGAQRAGVDPAPAGGQQARCAGQCDRARQRDRSRKVQQSWQMRQRAQTLAKRRKRQVGKASPRRKIS